MKAKDLRKDKSHFDVAIYGASGSGKTTWAARSPHPFIILTESQGLDSIVEANPDADVEVALTAERLFEILKALKTGKTKGTGADARFTFTLDKAERECSTVVLDSFTDSQDMLIDYITDGDPTAMKIQDWGTLKVLGTRLLKDLRDLPVSVVVLFLATETMDDAQSRRITPTVRGGVADSIGQFFNVFGFARAADVDKAREHIIDFKLSDKFITKAPRKWPSRIRSRLETPGDTTLGSICLAILGDHAPHAEGDSAQFLTVKDDGGTDSDKPRARGPRRSK